MISILFYPGSVLVEGSRKIDVHHDDGLKPQEDHFPVEVRAWSRPLNANNAIWFLEFVLEDW